MSDKRQVSTGALETLGQIIDEKAGRDAIHLAVFPAIAGETLTPGQDVGLIADGNTASADVECPVGIVDPFLEFVVEAGQWFWLIIYPRQIDSLRHVWSHPAFPEEVASVIEKEKIEPAPDKAVSEAWLRDWVEANDCPPYDYMMDALSVKLCGGHVPSLDPESYESGLEWHPGESFLTFVGVDSHADVPPEFWEHFEIVTGIKVSSTTRVTYFSCTC